MTFLRKGWQAYRRRLKWEMHEVECMLAQWATTRVEHLMMASPS